MKKYVTFYVESIWYLLNIEDRNEFQEGINHNTKDTLVTFQSSDLIRQLNTSFPRRESLPVIIDLESLDRQMSQKGKEIAREDKKIWKVLTRLHEEGFIDSEFRLTKSSIRTFLEKVADWYERLYINIDECERFKNIELEINQIIYKRQKLGVNIDSVLAKTKCSELEREIYFIKNKLQLFHNIFTPDDTKTQRNYLDLKKYTVIKSYLYSFKIRRKDDLVCNLFYELIRNQQDLDNILYILAHWGGETKCYPIYSGFGSITSRIMLRQPCLQNLRKQNRCIIVAEAEKKLLYVDYSQFEAGILASLCGDSSLIRLYDSDIYIDLAHVVLKNEDRKEAKIYFYRYMYGDKTLKSNVLNYFEKFPKLKEYQLLIEKEIIENKKIGTTSGNFRLVLDEEKYHWALSHKIQATASLIFKQALIKVEKEVPEAELLIPMHDGAVYQVDLLCYESVKSKIEEIYKGAFNEICPNISPRVNSVDEF